MDTGTNGVSASRAFLTARRLRVGVRAMGLVVALLAMWVLGAAPAVADTGLAGEWHLDQVDPGNPPTTPDSSGHGLTGTDVRGSLVPGRFGSGLQLMATGDGVDVPDAPALEPNRMTVMAWVKENGNPLQFRTIVGKGASGCSSRSYVLDVGSTPGGLRFAVTFSPSAFVAAEVQAAGIWDGQWHAIAGTYDGATVGLWVDGVEISSAPVPAGFTDVDYADYGPPGDTRLAFGRYVQPQGGCDQNGFQFLGALDEVRIYGRALSASEISYLQTAPGPTPPELPPAVTGISPSSGPAAGGTSVSITGTSFTGATAVRFGSAAASNFTVDSDSQITATAPAGSGAVDVSVTSPAGTSVTSASDRFTYVPAPPVITTAQPTVQSSTSGAFLGSVNPEGLQTTAHFEYGLDPRYGTAGGAVNYDQRTADVPVGSDSSAHIVSASVSGLLPNALYHVALVATNSAGSTRGGDQAFTTKTAPAPPPPTLGKTANLTPISGLVLIKPPPGKSLYAIRLSATSPVPTKGHGFIPLTQARQVPAGSQIDALRGTLRLVVASGKRHLAQAARLTGGIYTISQTARGVHKGLTTLSLKEGAFPGAPSYRSCTAKSAQTAAAGPRARKPKLSSQVLQTLRASDHHGNFRTRGRYSAATVRGTDWGIKDRCDGTLTLVHRGVVSVSVFATRKTITVRAGHSFLARALTARKRRK